MTCNNEYRLIEQSDFECVGQVAKHCDLPKLCIAIQESQEWDLRQLFCSFDVISIALEVLEYQRLYQAYLECLETEEECSEPVEPDNYELKLNLICGGTYNGCNGKERRHLGVKRILTYYAYSRYIILNGFTDTPNGQVSKTNDFTIPKSLKELESFSDKYRTMGFESFKMTQDFLCRNKDVFEDFDSCNCNGCGCADGCCDSRTKAKGYGLSGKIIKK